MKQNDVRISIDHPESLPDPLKPPQIAELLGVGVATVYVACKRFLATQGTEDENGIPCMMMGGTPDRNGNLKGGRILIPKGGFMAWYSPAAGAATERSDEVADLILAYRTADAEERAAAGRRAEAFERLLEVIGGTAPIHTEDERRDRS